MCLGSWLNVPEKDAPVVSQVVVEVELLEAQGLSVEVGEGIAQCEWHFRMLRLQLWFWEEQRRVQDLRRRKAAGKRRNSKWVSQ